MEDAEMIKLFVERKEKAISEVDASYGEKLHRIAFKILQNHADAEMDAPTQLVDPKGMSGDIQSSADQNGIIVLDRNSINYSPVNGVSIQSIRLYIGDTLRVQVYYEEILKTDNHGFISLQIKKQGNCFRVMDLLLFLMPMEAAAMKNTFLPMFRLRCSQTMRFMGNLLLLSMQ